MRLQSILRGTTSMEAVRGSLPIGGESQSKDRVGFPLPFSGARRTGYHSRLRRLSNFSFFKPCPPPSSSTAHVAPFVAGARNESAEGEHVGGPRGGDASTRALREQRGRSLVGPSGKPRHRARMRRQSVMCCCFLMWMASFRKTHAIGPEPTDWAWLTYARVSPALQ